MWRAGSMAGGWLRAGGISAATWRLSSSRPTPGLRRTFIDTPKRCCVSLGPVEPGLERCPAELPLGSLAAIVNHAELEMHAAESLRAIWEVAMHQKITRRTFATAGLAT